MISIENVSFSLKEKERVLLLGINGSVKSTLLKIINGLIFPKKGRYFYKNEEITEKKLKEKNFQKKFRKEVFFYFKIQIQCFLIPLVMMKLLLV